MAPRKTPPVITADLSPEQINAFQKLVLQYYRCNGRNLPWRAAPAPYPVLVSEIMLQQTQVDRVIPKYSSFMDRFPDVASLAAAPLKEVLMLWQGLGYNRRAQALQRCAGLIINEHGGRIPRCRETLQRLPGIGPYTAAAICVFAFNQPCVFIETNIRAVYIHSFFPEHTRVSDTQLEPLITATLYKHNPRRWYNALMDYGVFLKKQHANPARRSTRHAVQSRFEGSDRQIRGLAIKILGTAESMSMRALVQHIGKKPERVRPIIAQLVREGLVKETGTRLLLP